MKLFTPFLLLVTTTLLVACGSSGVNLIPVRAGDNSSKDGKFQFINKEGKIIINPQFEDAGIFRDGLALVRTAGDSPKYGFIKEDGKYAINATYKYATSFHDGLAWVVKENSAPEAITKDGKTAFTLKQADEVQIFSEGLAAFSLIDSSGSKWGFVDENGTTVINPQFSSCGMFSEGLCPVRNSEGKWGYVDKKGTLKISYQFQSAYKFENEKAVVESGDKFGVIDDNGKFIINPQFSRMTSDGDLFMVYQDDKWGWCDKEGKFIINAQFENAFPFGESDLAAVKSGKEYGYVNREGKFEINPQFKMALPFIDGLAAISNGNGEIGFIDFKGKFVINPQFNGIGEDYIYFANGNITSFFSVETDLFDISALTSRINLESPEGLTSTSTMGDAAVKFSKSASSFSLYSTEHQMLNSSTINRNISFDFFIFGDASKDEIVSSGYYQYSQKVFNSGAPITGFAYRFNLTGKGYGKGKSVLEAVDNLVTAAGFTKDQSLSSINDSAGYGVFNKSGKQIITRWENNYVILVSSPQVTASSSDSAPTPTDAGTARPEW
jgi:hypothetical protein